VAQRRKDVLDIPGRLVDLGACLAAAAWAVSTAQDEASGVTDRLNAQEKKDLLQALGLTGMKTLPRSASAQLKELEDQQALRAKRLVRDGLDSVLLQLSAFYRDVLSAQLKAGTALINTDMAEEVSRQAAASTPEATLKKIDRISECRTAISANVAPQLAFEALMVSLM
jgi:DNA polymerase-3 subunit delta'